MNLEDKIEETTINDPFAFHKIAQANKIKEIRYKEDKTFYFIKLQKQRNFKKLVLSKDSENEFFKRYGDLYTYHYSI